MYLRTGHMLMLCTLAFALGCADGKTPPAVTEMVQVPSMGFDLGEGAIDAQCKGGEVANYCDEAPPPPVTYPTWPISISAFDIDEHEVTNVQYQHCVAHGACSSPQFVNALGGGSLNKYYDEDDARFADYPVVNITMDQARDYCLWVGKRLPTVFEWEAAARHFAERVDGKTPPFMFGDSVEDCAGLQIAVAGCNADLDTPQPVKDSVNSDDAYSDNAGRVIYGIVGNVSEWTSTYYSESMHCADDISAFKRASGDDDCVNAYAECADQDTDGFQTCGQQYAACGDCRDEEDVTAAINPSCYGMCTEQPNATKWICARHVDRTENPAGPATGGGRAVRGGNYQTGSSQPQTPVAFDMCDLRLGAHVGLTNEDTVSRPTIGFRCARDL